MTRHPAPHWLQALRAYLAATLVANLIWEFAQLPLYTLWTTGSRGERAFAALHCTAGDLLIATASLTGALVLAGDRDWPCRSFRRVAALTVLIGLAYTAYSEWLNTVVRKAWAYSDLMPVLHLPGVEIGLSPLLQWIVVPLLALALARRAGCRDVEEENPT